MAEATPSVLDRLIDWRKTELAVDNREPNPETVIRYCLRRDLEWLLNTRRVAVALPDSLDTLQRSLYYYGMPDITTLSTDSYKDRARLLKMIERSIMYFEPRLISVRVTPIETTGSGTRILRFQIEAIHKKDPAPERVAFDVMQLTNGEYQVKGSRGA